jgi:signal transduction histidine kinase
MDKLPQQWLFNIVQHSSDATIVIDRDRIIRFANVAAAHMADSQAPEDIIGTSYDAHLSQSQIYDEAGQVPPPEWYPTHKAFTSGESTRDLVLEQVHRGRHFWLSVSCVPLIGESGEIEHAIVYFRDISAQKLERDKLNFLVESAKSLSLTTDFNERLTQKARLMVPLLADWCTVNVVEEGGTIARIAIVHRDEQKTPLVEELAVLSSQDAEATRSVRSVIETGEPWFVPYVSFETLAKGGSLGRRAQLGQELKVCSSMTLPIRSGGQVVGALSVAFAESGRHFTEEDLEFMTEYCNHMGLIIHIARLFEEISKRDKAKDVFLATLSHELRNPLAPIKSALELLKIQAQSDEYAEEIRVIEHQFNHLTKLLNDLLDVSRYSRGMITLEHSLVPVRGLIERIVQAHEPYIESKELKLEVVVPDEELQVWGDATRLEQSITNILHNAVKFTPEGGSIYLSVHRDEDNAVIIVRDSGMGMDRGELLNLFEGRSDRPRKRQAGLGIGLVLVREIVKLHGGHVEAQSAGPGQGSEFVISFPLQLREPAMV